MPASSQPARRDACGDLDLDDLRPPDGDDAAVQAWYWCIRQHEPMLDVANIQGNVLPGFNKDFQAFLFLKIVDESDDRAYFRAWLRQIVPLIATTEQVLAFNRLYKLLDTQEKTSLLRSGKPPTVQATWMNIAFTFEALRRLLPDAPELHDAAFKAGLADRSELLGDPRDEQHEGDPRNWVVGGPTNPADVVLIVASDDRNDLIRQIAWLESTIYAPRLPNGQRAARSLQVVYKQLAAVLPDPLSKNEHFGFRDGVSQPGVRGRLPHAEPGQAQAAEGKAASEHVPDTAADFLTPSETADKSKGKAGQDLVWPGEFVLGYRRQKGARACEVVEPGPAEPLPGPAWAEHGSYLVLRRLRQDVRTFREFFDTSATRLELLPTTELQSIAVGRWPSGAPLLTVGDEDEIEDQHVPDGLRVPDGGPRLGGDDARNNLFEFADRDPEGKACPFAAHIRKVYTRDDESTSLNELADELQEAHTSELTTQTHRMLRRGIPFGEPYNDRSHANGSDSGDRGLMFVAYQASIVRQFEFVTRALVNNPGFRVANPGAPPTEFDPGYDLVIGQNGSSSERERAFAFPVDKGVEQLRTTDEWVIPTGGGYFFAPSISALRDQIAK